MTQTPIEVTTKLTIATLLNQLLIDLLVYFYFTVILQKIFLSAQGSNSANTQGDISIRKDKTSLQHYSDIANE